MPALHTLAPTRRAHGWAVLVCGKGPERARHAISSFNPLGPTPESVAGAVLAGREGWSGRQRAGHAILSFNPLGPTPTGVAGAASVVREDVLGCCFAVEPRRRPTSRHLQGRRMPGTVAAAEFCWPGRALCRRWPSQTPNLAVTMEATQSPTTVTATTTTAVRYLMFHGLVWFRQVLCTAAPPGPVVARVLLVRRQLSLVAAQVGGMRSRGGRYIRRATHLGC